VQTNPTSTLPHQVPSTFDEDCSASISTNVVKPFPFQALLLRATHMIMRRPPAAPPALVSI
jgi:hypothetical protein